MTVLSRESHLRSSFVRGTNKYEDDRLKIGASNDCDDATGTIFSPRFGYSTLPNKLKKRASSSAGIY